MVTPKLGVASILCLHIYYKKPLWTRSGTRESRDVPSTEGFHITSLKILFRTMNSLKNIRRTKEIFMYKKYIDTTIRSTKTGNRTENRTPDHRENFMCKWTSMTKEIFLHKNYFEVQKPETGQKIGTRTNRKILWANEPACQKKFTYIKKFSMRPSEVQKPDPKPTGNFYGWTCMRIQICLHWNFSDRANHVQMTANCPNNNN